MPKIKYDVSNVDESGGFEHVQPGMYIGKITEINSKESKSGNGPMLEVILQPVKTADGKTVKPKDKKKKVGRVYTYVLLEHEPSDWKLKEFTKAVGLKDKGTLDTDKIVGMSVQMNLKPDTDLDDKYRPRVGKLIAMPNSASASASKTRPAPEPEPEQDEDAYTQDDLEAMDDDELVEAADEFGIAKPAGKMTPVKRKRLVTAILEAQEEEDEDEDEQDDEDIEDEEDEEQDEDEEDDEEDEDEEDDEEEDDTEDEEDLEDELNALDRAGLKAYIRDRELDITVRKSMEDDDIREAITEAVGSDEEEAVDYNSWSMDALKKEAQERGLSTKGSKKILAGRLSKDDEDDDNPF